ncbi:hypothetical protein IPA_09050 [Ignicoccus pacificus DSM 13166]|uniref:ATP-binding protein n=1 Tax=Ignicoccus pacificus DSM 13166 TaxID=940294 RepID=A0A977PKD9_9CREN|nr:hypothetical protein IPA_09050 [Ignicoccus pacificus DSM 13166]
MLFDLRPKERKEDLFGREEELRRLESFLDNMLGAIVYGIRRIGKTSLVKVYCSEYGRCAYVDVRGLYDRGITVNAFIEELLKGVRSLNDRIPSLEVDLRVLRFKREKKSKALSEVLEELDKRSMILVIDEAQLLRGNKVFSNVFAWALDNLSNLKIIFSGSEVGVLEKYLGLRDPSSPLYGRGLGELKLSKFSLELSTEFLRKGFEEVGMEVPEEEIEEAGKELGGIVGWLTLYGNLRLNGLAHEEALIRTKERAKKIIALELKNFLDLRPMGRKRYCCILRAIALGLRAWKDIKKYCNDQNDKNFTNALNKLIDYSFIEKVEHEYLMVDPLMRDAILDVCK